MHTARFQGSASSFFRLFYSPGWMQVDAERADEQLLEEDSLAHTLKEIVKRTLPCPRFARYFEMYLQVFLSRMGNYPPR